jgi:sugar transferase EpsL
MKPPEPYLFAKRLFDVSVGAVALVILGPLFMLIAVLIRLRLGRPVFFRQTRIGLAERPFRIWKFRTMVACTNTRGSPLPDATRLTPLGRFLRAGSLDELPQLLNVLSGEMSLIGPRPLLPEYLPRYSPFQRRRHEVKPGITGWAQVNGRNALTWEERFVLDVWYTGQRSIWLDMRILWITVWKVVLRKNVSQAGHVTMPEFSGEMDRVQNV